MFSPSVAQWLNRTCLKFLLEYLFLKYPPLNVILTELTSIPQNSWTNLLSSWKHFGHHSPAITNVHLWTTAEDGQSAIIFRMISFSPWTIIFPLLQELNYEMHLPHFPHYRINLLNFTFLSISELKKILFSTGIILDRPNCSVIACFVLCMALFC